MQTFNNANRVAHIAHGIYSGSVPSVGAIPVRNGPMPTQGFGYTPPTIGETQPARNPVINRVSGGSSFVRPSQGFGYSGFSASGSFAGASNVRQSQGFSYHPNIYNVGE